MITLTKRPQPVMQTTYAERVPMDEAVYAEMLRKSVKRKPNATTVDNLKFAIKEGCETTMECAEFLGLSVSCASSGLRKMEALGIVTRTQDGVSKWRLK